MKLAALLSALVPALLLFVTPVFAQTLTLEPLEPGAAPDSPKVESQPKAKPASRPRRMRRANADARHCLDLQSNTAIIKCAERYL